MWPGHPPLEEGNRGSLHHVDYLFSVLTISDLTVAKVTFLEGAETGSCGVFGGGRGRGEEDYSFFLFNRKKKNLILPKPDSSIFSLSPCQAAKFSARQLGEDALADKTYLFPKTLSATVTEINMYSRQKTMLSGSSRQHELPLS